jgi:hypothetical protein
MSEYQRSEMAQKNESTKTKSLFVFIGGKFQQLAPTTFNDIKVGEYNKIHNYGTSSFFLVFPDDENKGRFQIIEAYDIKFLTEFNESEVFSYFYQ